MQMSNLHFVQIQILRELLLNSKLRFTDMNVSGLTSDHFNYHIKMLIQDELVRKDKSLYILTAKGKEFANTLDTENYKIEKQGKIGVLIIATKNKKFLIQTRLKEPFYGYKGFVSGKVRFGETIIEGGNRELKEETGLTGKLSLKYILHEHVYSEDNELLEDKFFYVLSATNIKGTLRSFQEGKNEWMTEKEFRKQEKIFYDEKDILKWFKIPPSTFLEKKYTINDF